MHALRTFVDHIVGFCTGKADTRGYLDCIYYAAMGMCPALSSEKAKMDCSDEFVRYLEEITKKIQNSP